ncbi:rod shape-determining protein MreC [Desulfosporosinus orientis DSM 765]|uniref:Cell shape-determining protein MreC n=1 Tax=Desulfosporosinus orientis (strain ATCC 19365 / DSM 765 / NCIMB 8382 / VKM B-1628 / Singapore I) TaxID=768706 RepID=G7W788_DESOD|nr:rod shape-determining protein MreC [Desulfosporosinus orientis]AET70596.1 rod shape-determining protein MreC [Desulfosporosinus orientis DSM 765]
MVGKRVNITGIAVLVFFLLLGVLITIRFTGLGSNFPNPIGGAMQRVLSPLEKPILGLGNAIKDNTRALWSFSEVAKQNEELRKKVDQLTGDNIKLKTEILAGMRYNELDQGQFRSPTLEKFEKVGATVINRNPTTWYRTLTLNRGSQDGVTVNSPVIGDLGLVGKIVSVTPTTSEVLLILDGEGQVSAVVRGSTGGGTFGIVQGNFTKGSRLTSEGNLQMLFRREDGINVGDLVFTSGIGGVYPKDVPIGQVKEIQLDPSGLLKTAYIQPLIDFDSLEEVYIVKKGEGK